MAAAMQDQAGLEPLQATLSSMKARITQRVTALRTQCATIQQQLHAAQSAAAAVEAEKAGLVAASEQNQATLAQLYCQDRGFE